MSSKNFSAKIRETNYNRTIDSKTEITKDKQKGFSMKQLGRVANKSNLQVIKTI